MREGTEKSLEPPEQDADSSFRTEETTRTPASAGPVRTAVGRREPIDIGTSLKQIGTSPSPTDTKTVNKAGQLTVTYSVASRFAQLVCGQPKNQ